MTSEWGEAGESSVPPIGSSSAPSPSRDYPITINIPYPEPGELNRFMIFVKWLLIIPHILLLVPLLIGVWFATWFAWWAILFTGRYPRSLFDFIVGAYQWNLRTVAYSGMLATDVYPPFSLGRPLRGAAIVALVCGVLTLLAIVGLYAVLLALLATFDPNGFEGGRGMSTPFPAPPGRGGFR